VRDFVIRHTKAKEVKISQDVNSLIWSSGIKKPPGMITVKVKVTDGIATVRLPGEVTLEEEKAKFLAKKEADKKGAKKDEAKSEEAAAPAEEGKSEAKEEPAAEEKKEEKAHEKQKKAVVKKEKKPKAEKK
jgi:hypothetical protein